MAAKKKLTYESVRGMKEKPKSIAPAQYEGTRAPRGYKVCPACGHFVRGPQTKICPSCNKDISPSKRDRKGSRTSSNGLGLVDYTNAQNLIELLGGIEQTNEILTTLQQFGSLDEAKTAVDAWANLIEATGSAERAQATLSTLQNSGALN